MAKIPRGEWRRRDYGMAIPPGGVFMYLFIYFFIWRGFCYRACGLARQTERDRETESEKSLPRGDGHAAIPSPLGILGTHVHMPGVSFKPPGPGHEPQSTTWESNDTAITLTAGPKGFLF